MRGDSLPHRGKLEDDVQARQGELVPVIYENVIHFQICRLRRVLFFEFNEGVLETILCLPVLNDFSSSNSAKLQQSKENRFNSTESNNEVDGSLIHHLGENELEILTCGNGVQFAAPDNIFRWFLISVLNISDHL